VVECPTAQNIVGKAKTVQRKELEDGNARIQHAILYLSSLTDNETSAPSSSPNADILRFNTSISTSKNKFVQHIPCLIAAHPIVGWILAMPTLWA